MAQFLRKNYQHKVVVSAMCYASASNGVTNGVTATPLLSYLKP